MYVCMYIYVYIYKVYVCEKAVVFLFEKSKTHLDKTACSSLKLPLEQGVLHITRGFRS